jgi:Cu+-exporting ATPase
MQDPSQPQTTNEMIDPVCDMTVTAESPHRYLHKDIDYRFCHQSRQHKFAQDPEHFLSGAAQQKAEPVPGAIYICPMDPEVEQDHPGSCPICGMALEPAGAPKLSTRSEYSGPMHPEFVEQHPGNCPSCGMTLELRSVEI